MKNMIQKFKNNLNNVSNEEAGDVIQNVLIIAVFVIIVGVVGNILYKAIVKQGNATSKCIEKIGANVGAQKGC